MVYCVTCASAYVLVPLFAPLHLTSSAAASARYRHGHGEAVRPPSILKANLWIAVFSFVGNYWYTHYFYGVLNARYTFDAHRLNDVPIALYFMTHAYFMFYHVLSNCAPRRVRSFGSNARRAPVRVRVRVDRRSWRRATAFMESLTICGFPYYSFEDGDMARTLGSAFYGLLPRVVPHVPEPSDEAAGGGGGEAKVARR